MTAIFCHLAAGRFGAECLGRLYELVAEERVYSPKFHRYFWLGVGDRPPPRLTPRPMPAPVWSLEVPDGWCTVTKGGAAQDRCALAASVLQSLSNGGQAAKLRHWLEGLLDKTRRQGDPVEVHLVVSGSLADPGEAGIILGWYRGMAALHAEGRSGLPQLHVLASVGASTSEWEPEADRLSIVAASLRDLDAAFASRPDGFWAPIYLVGEDAPDPHLTWSRPENVAVAACSLMALAQAYNLDERNLPRHPLPLVSRWAGHVVEWGRSWQGWQELHKAKPFATLGSHMVIRRNRQVARIVAARLCRDFFVLLRQQIPDVKSQLGSGVQPITGSTPAPLPLSEAAVAFVARLVDEASKSSLAVLARKFARKEPQLGSWEGLEGMLGSIMEDPVFQRLLKVYGADRFFALPIDDWEHALAEFRTLAEDGFLAQRRECLKRMSRDCLDAVREGLISGLDRLFAEACLDAELGLQPHLLARRFCEEFANQLGKAHAALEERRLGFGHTEDPATHVSSLETKRQELLHELGSIPSPFAVWCRGALIWAASSGLFLALPLPASLAWIGPSLRLAAAFTSAGVVMVGLRERAHRSVARAFAGIRDWLQEYTSYLDRLDQKARRECAEAALLEARNYLKGLGAPAVPARSASGSTGTTAPTESDINQILNEFPIRLDKAVTYYGKLMEELGRGMTSSAETSLPRFDPDHPANFCEADYRELLGVPAEAPAPILTRERAVTVLSEIKQAIAQRSLPAEPTPHDRGVWLPFFRMSPATLARGWHEPFPSEPATLPYPPKLDGECLASFYTAAAELWLPMRLRHRSLKTEIGTDPDLIRSATERLNLWSQPTVTSFGTTESFLMCIDAGTDDPVGCTLRSPRDHVNALGAPILSAVCRSSVGLSAGELLESKTGSPRRSVLVQGLSRATTHSPGVANAKPCVEPPHRKETAP